MSHGLTSNPDPWSGQGRKDFSPGRARDPEGRLSSGVCRGGGSWVEPGPILTGDEPKDTSYEKGKKMWGLSPRGHRLEGTHGQEWAGASSHRELQDGAQSVTQVLAHQGGARGLAILAEASVLQSPEHTHRPCTHTWACRGAGRAAQGSPAGKHNPGY